jgi:phosphoribosylanthranilate isomerase
MSRTRIKICCIASVAEARTAVGYGADALGLVGAMPSGPGPIDEGLAARIATATPPPVATFLLTSETTAEAIKEHVERVRPTVVQIVNHIAPLESERLARLLPAVRRVQVVHVEGPEALDMFELYRGHVHAFLLDSGRPAAKIAELGGTGRVHDWDVSRVFVEQSPLPVFLAGGLSPENVQAAVSAVRPYGVDLCTGVRTEGKLDETLLSRFVRAVAKADAIACG